MTHITLTHLINREIDLLNTQIDKKILKGKSYYKDAQKHQALVAQYRRIVLRKKTYISVGSLVSM